MESDGKIKVMIAVDEMILRNGIAATIASENMDVVAQTDSNGNIQKLLEDTHPHVLIISDGFSDTSGPELIKEVKNIYPDVGILVMSPLVNNTAKLKALLDAGATSCLPIYASPKQLIAAIKSIYHGQTAGCFELVKQIISKNATPEITAAQDCPLNRREQQILTLISQGMTNKAIGKQLEISDRTVDSYFRNIFSKLSVSTRTEALYKVIKNDWLDI